jgi:hypothetical protein
MISQAKMFAEAKAVSLLRKASFICIKCLLLLLSLLFFVWGVFAYVPTQGPHAGHPSFLNKLQDKMAPKVCPYGKATNVVEH